MAHSLSAKKRIRQNLKRRALNRSRKTELRQQVKVFGAVLASGDAAKAEAELRKTATVLDRTAARGTIHKNTAARKRSRLTRALNALKARPAAAPAQA